MILFDRHRRAGRVRNIESPEQVTRLIADLRAFAPGRELIEAIDQEGGYVTRLSPAYGFPKVASEAAVGEEGDAKVRSWADGLAGTLAGVGVNLELRAGRGPQRQQGQSCRRRHRPRLRDRHGGGRARRGDRGRGAIAPAAFAAALKHFPGLGSATINTDYGVADVTSTWTPVRARSRIATSSARASSR